MLAKLVVANSIQVIATIAALTLSPFHLRSEATEQRPNERVKLDAGWIQGALADDVLSFKGIPYATPPVGTLRWRSPQPVQPWTGIRHTTQFGNDCMQFPDPSDAAPPGTAPAEDCLFINVWRPAAIAPGVKLPVVVWIHGGAFVNGGSSSPRYDGSEIARQGITVVSFNYRLGRFGFFAHPALRAEQADRMTLSGQRDAIANYAFMDQLAALQWVQRNIAAFQGNPDQVTLMGESAGGISVMHLLTWEAANGLFNRAIVLSGGGRNFLSEVRQLTRSTVSSPSAEEIGIRFARTQGIRDTGAAGLAALRSLPAAAVTGDLNMTNLIKRPPTYAGGPIQDGQIVHATPGALLQRGKVAQVPMLIGTTTQDLPAILPPLKDPVSFFGSDATRAIALYNPTGTLQPFDLALQIGADISIHEPARFVAQQMTTLGQPVWLYRFGYVAQSLSSGNAGATHASELPFLFGPLAARDGNAVTPQDQTAGQQFRRYMTNFIKTGNPNGSQLPLWLRFNPTRSQQLMKFTPDGAAVMQADPWKERLDLVERAINSPSESSAAR